MAILVLAKAGGLAADVPGASPTSDLPQWASEVQGRIKELDAATDVDEAQKTKLLDLYRQVLSRIEATQKSRDAAEAFRKSVQDAPQELEKARQDVAKLRSSGEAELQQEIRAVPADQLQVRLTQEQAELSSLKARLADSDKRLKESQDRPDRAQAELAEAKTALATIEKGLAEPAPSVEDPEVDRVQRMLLVARREFRLAEIRMLDQEIVTHPLRAELIVAGRDRIAQQIAHSESKIRALDERIRQVRQEEEERARREAERLRREAIGKHRLIQAQAEELTVLTRETEELGTKTDHAKLRRAAQESQLTLLKADLYETERSLELGEDDETLGAVLLEQRRTLPDLNEYESELRRLSIQRSQARLRVFQLERKLKQLSSIQSAADQLLRGANIEPSAKIDREGLRAELLNLLQKKREQIERLVGAARAYHDELGRLEGVQKELLQETGDLTLLLEQQLIWIQNAANFGPGTISALGGDLRWWANPVAWRSLLGAVRDDVSRNAAAYVVVVLTTALLLLLRRRLAGRLDATSEAVRKVRGDRLMNTFKGLWFTLFLSLPIALVLGFLGWRLIAVSAPREFSGAVGRALAVVALLSLIIRLLRVLARPGGVGEVHFRWNERSLQQVRRELAWYSCVVIPSAFVFSVTYCVTDPAFHQRSGRVAFLVAMVATSILAYRLFHPKRGLQLNLQHGLAPVLLRRTRGAWHTLCSAIPLLLAACAAIGYTYMAFQFTLRIVETVLWIQGLVLLYALLYRWVVLSQRRLAIKVALEKRQAQERSRESSALEESQEAILDMLDEIDVAEVKEQTLDILRITVGFLLLLGLWISWAGVVPALGFLQTVELWHHSVVIDGQTVLQPVTLWSLMVSIVFLLLTIAAARNMPGLLEITLLQRLPMDPGTRYATRTIVLYLIVTTGVVFTFNALGVSWSSVQWLVAALTVGLGFGLQEIFANFVSGVILLLERPIRVGDTVTVGTISGVVTRIRMRATTITDWNRKELIVPNRNFITGELINWSLLDPVLRMDFTVGIAYGSDTILAQQVMLNVCREHSQVLKTPEPDVFFVGFGDNSLNFEVRVFVAEQTNSGRTRIIHDLHMGIDRACRENNITIAFPQRDLHLKTADALIRVVNVRAEDAPNTPVDQESKTAPGTKTTVVRR